MMIFLCSDKYYTNILRLYRLNSPVIEIVSQFSVTRLEKQVVFNVRVLHDLSQIKHIKMGLFGENQGIFDNLFHPCWTIIVHESVVAVSGAESLISIMAQNGRI